jgi:hypothetical protein
MLSLTVRTNLILEVVFSIYHPSANLKTIVKKINFINASISKHNMDDLTYWKVNWLTWCIEKNIK